MKKLWIVFIAVLLLFSSCRSAPETKVLKIAVLGDSSTFPNGYQEGIQKAWEETRAEYKEKGFDIQCSFYDDEGDYEKGAAFVNEMAADPELTGVIASQNQQINKYAAFMLERNKKIMVAPLSVYDELLKDNVYKNVFSLCYSGEEMGKTMVSAMVDSKAVKWAVCYGENNLSKAQMRSIAASQADGVTVMDYVSINQLQTNFDQTCRRWLTLGVEGIVLFPEDGNLETLQLLGRLKSKNKNWVLAGDYRFDNAAVMDSSEEIRESFQGFILTDLFSYIYDPDQWEAMVEKYSDYSQENGGDMDTWFLQGYNSFRMIVDTGIDKGTSVPGEIAEFLHQNGYEGMAQNFQFDEKGQFIGKDKVYAIFVGSIFEDYEVK